ncbi:unnamed protein product [Blumeria hordei]|uniref:Uncharacterized protein n=1 Tax=Blumeria hordei TaxID=2867405 RepID=A0A383UMA1_BLUHO|nr:unnamed protein product [Blumeria hordei]
MLFTHLKKTPLLLILMQFLLISTVYGTRKQGTLKPMYVCGNSAYPVPAVMNALDAVRRLFRKHKTNQLVRYTGTTRLPIFTGQTGEFYEGKIKGSILWDFSSTKRKVKGYVIVNKQRDVGSLVGVVGIGDEGTYSVCEKKMLRSTRSSALNQT